MPKMRVVYSGPLLPPGTYTVRVTAVITDSERDETVVHMDHVPNVGKLGTQKVADEEAKDCPKPDPRVGFAQTVSLGMPRWTTSLLATQDVHIHTLRRRVNVLEEQGKFVSTNNERQHKELWNRITELQQHVNALNEAVRVLNRQGTPAEKRWEEDVRYRQLEENIKSCMTMFAEIQRAHNELNFQLNGPDGLARRVRVLCDLTKRKKMTRKK